MLARLGDEFRLMVTGRLAVPLAVVAAVGMRAVRIGVVVVVLAFGAVPGVETGRIPAAVVMMRKQHNALRDDAQRENDFYPTTPA